MDDRKRPADKISKEADDIPSEEGQPKEIAVKYQDDEYRIEFDTLSQDCRYEILQRIQERKQYEVNKKKAMKLAREKKVIRPMWPHKYQREGNCTKCMKRGYITMECMCDGNRHNYAPMILSKSRGLMWDPAFIAHHCQAELNPMSIEGDAKPPEHPVTRFLGTVQIADPKINRTDQQGRSAERARLFELLEKEDWGNIKGPLYDLLDQLADRSVLDSNTSNMKSK